MEKLLKQALDNIFKWWKVLAVLNFETRRLPNHPMVRVKIGKFDLLGSFDTGQYGLLQLDDQAATVLKTKCLVVRGGNDAYDDPIVNVSDMVLDGKLKVSVKGITPITVEQTAPFRKGMQISEASYICFGYRFLDQYKTVWDYGEKKIYVLEKWYLEQVHAGIKHYRYSSELQASVIEGVDEATFTEITEGTKAHCLVSKALSVAITLTVVYA